MSRHYTPADDLIEQVDQALRTLFGRPHTTGRTNPAAQQPTESELDARSRLKSARLMRVNHSGEVCAQALYQGQALTARLDQVRERMEQAAREENDHLLWCEQRLQALGSHTSYFNPLFYLGSLALGAGAGLLGDKWSLGFVAETERQVVDHLEDHLQRMSPADKASRAILEQMQRDEAQHGSVAVEAGAAELPSPVKQLMRLMSKVMTHTTYWT